MGEPEQLTDQQQRDAHLVRQTRALEKIGRDVALIKVIAATAALMALFAIALASL